MAMVEMEVIMEVIMAIMAMVEMEVIMEVIMAMVEMEVIMAIIAMAMEMEDENEIELLIVKRLTKGVSISNYYMIKN